MPYCPALHLHHLVLEPVPRWSHDPQSQIGHRFDRCLEEGQIHQNSSALNSSVEARVTISILAREGRP